MKLSALPPHGSISSGILRLIVYVFLVGLFPWNTSFAQVFTMNATAAPAELGKTSWASSWGDYDNDNDLDLYVSNYYNQNFLYKNNGNGSFTKVTTGALVLSTLGHWSSTWVDFDNDADLDLYITNSYTDNAELLRNNGNGTFTSISSAITNTSDVDDNNAAWADTDNDGDLDLFLANGSNSTPETRNQNNSYYINNGNGTFSKNTTSVISNDGGFSQFGSFADYDNDGDQDLIVINTFQDSFFYENTGSGSFTKVLNMPFLAVGEQPLTACWGDLNNDGNLDLVIGSYLDSRIYYSNGDKTFRVATFPGISGNATGVSLGDFDLDGFLDVIFIRTGQSALYYKNNGDESFTNTNAGDLTSAPLDYTNSGAVADYDRDGDLDVFVNNDNSDNILFDNGETTGNWIGFKLVGHQSNAQGIGAKVMIRIGSKWQMREIGILQSYRTQHSVLANFGIGSAKCIDALRVIWPSGKVQNINTIHNRNLYITIDENQDCYDFVHSRSSAIVTDSYDSHMSPWADYDKDGFLDVLVGNLSGSHNMNLYRNQGDGTFLDQAGTSIPNNAGGAYGGSWGDHDNDGDVDLLVTNSDPAKPNMIYTNSGTGNFTGTSVTKTNVSMGGVWADFNKDGKLDAFVANNNTTTPSQSNLLYTGNGSGTLTPIADAAIAQDKGIASSTVVLTDVESDGDVDIFIPTASPQKDILYRNTGDGTFVKDAKWTNISESAQTHSAVFGDYDNDGDQDLYLSGKDALYNNNGLGEFTKVSAETFDDENSKEAAWGDQDNDGDLDLLVIHTDASLPNTLFQNNGGGSFTRLSSVITQETSNIGTASWTDINNDGYLDLFIGTSIQNKLYINQGGILNYLDIELTGVQSNRSGIGATIRIKVGNQWMTREVFSYRNSSLRTHFGLAEFEKADLVRVEWPSGRVQLLYDVPANQILNVTEQDSPNTPQALSLTLSTNEDSPLHFEHAKFINAFKDNDGDRLKEIKINNASMPAGQLQLNGTTVSNGDIIPIDQIDNLTFIPELNYNGTANISFSSIDTRGLEVEAILPINVLPVNDKAVVEGQVSLMTDEDQSITLSLADFTITDVDNQLANETLKVMPGLNYAVSGNAVTPTANFNGTLSVLIVVSDGNIDSTPFNATITVNSVNDTPVITGQTELATLEDSPLLINIVSLEIADPDNVLDDFVLTVLPGNSYTFNGNTVTPAMDFNGVIHVPVIVNDGTNDSKTFNVNVTVIPVNDPPRINKTNKIVTEVNTPVKISLSDLSISDPDNVQSDFEIIIAAGANYSHSGQTISPDKDFQGQLSIPITVSDGTSSSNLVNFIIDVMPPTITGIEDLNITALSVYPNPASTEINITGVAAKDIQVIAIVGANGSAVKFDQSSNEERITIRAGQLPPGNYTLIMRSATGEKFAQKLIINRQ